MEESDYGQTNSSGFYAGPSPPFYKTLGQSAVIADTGNNNVDVQAHTESAVIPGVMSKAQQDQVGLFDCGGSDELSSQDSTKRNPTPITEDTTEETLYCHLCSFCCTSRIQYEEHLEGHLEHKCDKCDYTSRTEGRLKQHLQKFHADVEQNKDDGAENDGSSSPDSPVFGAHSIEEQTSPNTPTNSRASGRQKVYRCKQCEFTATEKTDFWNHARVHIKEEKLLQCPKCPFVTEYKHHLEYHLRNHFGSKPFKCNKCNYACVNKSMLNSHMKSHTNIYQYRCADCTYATKYCHSLKLHLRKYNHQPASILNLDGTVDHDTSALLTMKRSGPKGKPKDSKSATMKEETSSISPPIVTSGSSTSMRMPAPPTGLLPFWPLAGGMRGPAPPPLLPMNFGNFFRGFLPPMLRQPPLSADMNMLDTAKSFSSALTSEPTLTSSVGSPDIVSLFNGHQQNAVREMRHTIPWRNEFSGQMKETTATSTAACDTPVPSNPFPSEKVPFRANSADSDAAWKEDDGEAPLDLTKAAKEAVYMAESNDHPLKKRCRKGKALKLDDLCLKLQEKVDSSKMDDDMKKRTPPISTSATSTSQSVGGESNEHIISLLNQDTSIEPNNNSLVLPRPKHNNLAVPQPHPLNKASKSSSSLTTNTERYNCPYCDITFSNCVMYTMHMGYHGYTDPFKCNMCGVKTADRVAFFLHIARAAHA